MKINWLLVALILGVVGPLYAFTDAYQLYVQNRSQHSYRVRIKNEDSRWTDTQTVEAGGCVRFLRIEPGDWSIRVYKGSMLSDYADFEVDDEDWCILIRSETGKVETCYKYFCN